MVLGLAVPEAAIADGRRQGPWAAVVGTGSSERELLISVWRGEGGV
jgi:hypothetical protein